MTYYQKILESDNFSQGDIFLNLPFLKLDTTKIIQVIAEGEDFKHKESDLLDITGDTDGYVKESVLVDAEIRPGIIITQNCDLFRTDYISYCAIKEYKSENVSAKEGRKENNIAKFSDEDKKTFFLPDDPKFDFSNKMFVDFSMIQQIHKDVMLGLIKNRRCTIDGLPLEHFRVKLSAYFKRYAYDKWYIFNKNEFSNYKNFKEAQGEPKEELDRIHPFPWQE